MLFLFFSFVVVCYCISCCEMFMWCYAAIKRWCGMMWCHDVWCGEMICTKFLRWTYVMLYVWCCDEIYVLMCGGAVVWTGGWALLALITFLGRVQFKHELLWPYCLKKNGAKQLQTKHLMTLLLHKNCAEPSSNSTSYHLTVSEFFITLILVVFFFCWCSLFAVLSLFLCVFV